MTRWNLLFVTAVALIAGSVHAVESPVFKTGSPTSQAFVEWVNGYGALGEDQSHVSAYVDSSPTHRIKTGSEAFVTLETLGGDSVHVSGTVSSVIPNADPQTGQSIVTIGLPRQTLPSRTYASVRIKLHSEKRLAVPTDAILMDEGKPSVFKSDGKDGFIKTPVVIGQQNPDFTEIKSGLAPGDTILIEGIMEWEANESGFGGEED